MGASLTEKVLIDEQLANAPQGVYTFNVQGTKCRRVSTLIPIETRNPTSAQMHAFDIDMEAQVNKRRCIIDGLDGEIVAALRPVPSKRTSSKCSCELANLYTKEFSTYDWQLKQAPVSRFANTQSPYVLTRWPPFYLGAERDILNQRGEGVEAVATGTRRTFRHGELGWRLAVRYQGDATSHCGIALRDLMRDVSTLPTEMSVPCLSGSPGTSRLVIGIK